MARVLRCVASAARAAWDIVLAEVMAPRRSRADAGVAGLQNSDIEADGFVAGRSCIAALLASPKAAVIVAASSGRDWGPAA